jgi:hypothetical protein
MNVVKKQMMLDTGGEDATSRCRNMSQSTDSLERLVRAIAADRNFEGAATGFIESYVAWRRTRGGYNKVISSNARRRIMRTILCLHFGNVADNPDDGATFERLLTRSNANIDDGLDGCGPRVLRTVISLAQRSGHLTVSQGWYDRRLKILRPTEKWIAEDAERHEVGLASLGLLAQDRSRFAARPRGEALVGRLAVIGGRQDRAVGVTLGEPAGPIRALGALDGGLATAFAVAEAWMRGKRLPSHKEIGASFRLSASQARKILRLAADHALVGFDRDGKIDDASGLAAACRNLVAHEFALYARFVAPFEAVPAEPLVAAAVAGEPRVAPALVAERPAEHAH